MHTYREKNQVADTLAKHETTLAYNASTTIFVQPPPFAMKEFLAYQRGTLHRRPLCTTLQVEPSSFCLDNLMNPCMDNVVHVGGSDQILFCNTATPPTFAPCNIT